MKDYKKFAAKDFKTQRLKKKQISRLNEEYERLRKKHRILGTSLTLCGDITPKEDVICRIGMIYNTIDIMEKSGRGEIWTIGDDGEGYLPKDQPGFVAK